MTQASSTEVRLRVSGDTHMLALLGERDAFLRLVEQAFPAAQIVARGDELSVTADAKVAAQVKTVFSELLVLVHKNLPLDADRIRRVINLVKSDVERPSDVFSDSIAVGRGKVVRPKTFNQKVYLDAIRAHLQRARA